MTSIAARTTAHFSGADNHQPHSLSAAVCWDLHDLAASGHGMSKLAATTYRSDSWSLVTVVWHEAGHAAVARAYGDTPWISITSPRSGFCECTLGEYRNPKARRFVGLSGNVATDLAHYGRYWPDELVARCVLPQYLSDSDRIIAGAYTEGDVKLMANFVRRAWAEIENEAAQVLARELARWGVR